MVRLSLFAVAVTTVAAQNIAISGAPTKHDPNGAVPIRREVRDLQTNFPDQFNLFLLGLRDFQAINESDQTSYYQISGIHGMPYKAWNGVASTSDWEQTGGFGGYCTHSSILFAPWHRPYIALWEQYLYTSVQKVASRFPAGELRDKYVTEAETFRAPYWDWASLPPDNSPAFPTVFSSDKIQVTDVDGTRKQINNPLYRFAFHPVNPSPGDFNAQWSRYPTTVRRPDGNRKSQDQLIAPIIANELTGLRSNVGLLLLSYKNFDAFSFSQWDPETNPGQYGSLENVHNVIHDLTGGGGHMSSLATSSFDPIFWMHHINVDRLWAIWQDLNPDSFLSPRPAPYSTFSTSGGTIEDRDSPLIPFWDSTGTKFWTSAEIKNSTTLFGYAYPETQSWLYKGNTTAYQAAIRANVSDLYGMNVFSRVSEDGNLTSPSSLAVRSVTGRRAAVKHLATSKRNTAENEPPIPPPLQHLAPNNTYTEYTVNIRASKLGLGQSFRILAFLGPYNQDPKTWDLEYNLIGRVSILTRNMDTSNDPFTISSNSISKSANTNTNYNPDTVSTRDTATDIMTSGTIPLTTALLQDILDPSNTGLKDLTPESVVPYLREHLDWKATLFTGEEQDIAEIPGLEISVAATEVTIGEDGVAGYEGVWEVLGDVTKGRVGGL